MECKPFKHSFKNSNYKREFQQMQFKYKKESFTEFKIMVSRKVPLKFTDNMLRHINNGIKNKEVFLSIVFNIKISIVY